MKKIVYIIAVFLLAGLAACKKNDGQGERQLSVKSFWPNSGNAGTIVTVTGTGFGSSSADVEVLFNGAAAKVMDVRDTVVKVLAPEKGASGMITLKTGKKSADVGQYTYQDLSLVGISPANGPAGTNISIHGLGFSSLKGPAEVTVNGKKAIVTSNTDTLLVAAVPVAAGTGKVVVTVDGKVVTGPDFQFQNISGIKPLTGGKGTTVTILGEGFDATAANNLVAFNGKTATVVSASATQLVVKAPDGVQTGAVTVSIKGQQTVGNTFTVVPFPVIKAIAPLSGPQGVDVTISGSNYSDQLDEVKVTFNGIPAVVSSTNGKAIVVKVPAGAVTGTVVVTVNDQPMAGPDFKEQNLGVAKLVPDNGFDGDEITINGVGFSTTATDNKVTFNGVPAVVSSATATSLTVVVPQNVTTGPVNIEVGGLPAQGPVFGRAGVMTLATGTGNTSFTNAQAIAADSKGNVYVAAGTIVKKISPAGVVTDFAGSIVSGNEDGTGVNARFSYLGGITCDANDNIWVTDAATIKRITPGAVVSTVANPGFYPSGIGSDWKGNIYYGQSYNGLYIYNKATASFDKYPNSRSDVVNWLGGFDENNLYFSGADFNNPVIYQIVNGTRAYLNSGNYGYLDGPVKQSQFGYMNGMCVDPDGVIYVMDASSVLRRIADGVVTTIAGTYQKGGYVDGNLRNALFRSPKAICADKDGNVYVLDQGNNAVRKVFFK